MSGVTIKEWFMRVNAVWPPGKLPPLTERAARTAAKRLWRWATRGRLTMPIVATSGNRYTWTHHGTLRVNASRGWENFVHDMAHLLWQRENPGAKPHEKGYAKFELAMRKEVLRRGWLDGKIDVLEDEVRSADRRFATVQREARVRASLDRAERRLAMLTRSVRKLRTRVRYYDHKKAVAS